MIFHQIFLPHTVVQQYYESEVNNEYVIRGNAAILKCSIPSFVADFIQVISWQDETGELYASVGDQKSSDSISSSTSHYGINVILIIEFSSNPYRIIFKE